MADMNVPSSSPLLAEQEPSSTLNAETGIQRKIDQANRDLVSHFSPKIAMNLDLTRALVSFQANKEEAGYRWYKYKEGFSSALVNYVFDKLHVKDGPVFDPFAGSGTTLFGASARGLDSIGIELLPIGLEIIKTRKAAMKNRDKVSQTLDEWINDRPWIKSNGQTVEFPHLRITNGAFSKKTEQLLGNYLGLLLKVKDKACRDVLRLASLCVLEEISYTRKDGQYLRWDYRSGRRQGEKQFDKGTIKEFSAAVVEKLLQIKQDLSAQVDTLFSKDFDNTIHGKIETTRGSVLNELPRMKTNSCNALMTSPPYCNRYDYTRTYALELALLGIDEDELRRLRQTMLSCTVENREKDNLERLFKRSTFDKASSTFESQKLLNYICEYLELLKEQGLLNNSGISRMVKNYFWEMTLVIFECARILRPGAPMIMVNDNVRYAGVSIPVDLILSRIAEEAGFSVEAIWVLPRGKGNSSQQMGEHGREELRKCVYVWRMPKEK